MENTQAVPRTAGVEYRCNMLALIVSKYTTAVKPSDGKGNVHQQYHASVVGEMLGQLYNPHSGSPVSAVPLGS